jgi:hypothetical protein
VLEPMVVKTVSKSTESVEKVNLSEELVLILSFLQDVNSKPKQMRIMEKVKY